MSQHRTFSFHPFSSLVMESWKSLDLWHMCQHHWPVASHRPAERSAQECGKPISNPAASPIPKASWGHGSSVITQMLGAAFWPPLSLSSAFLAGCVPVPHWGTPLPMSHHPMSEPGLPHQHPAASLQLPLRLHFTTPISLCFSRCC